MKRLFSYLKHYKKESVLAPLFKLLEASFELIVPLIIAAIIDRGISESTGSPDTSFILKMCLCLVLLAVIGFICAVVAQFFAARAAVGVSSEVKRSLFNKIQSLSFTDFDTLGNSRMINAMTGDTAQVQNAVNLVLRLFLRTPIIVFGAMIMAFTVDTYAALTFVVVIPLLSLVVFGIMALTVPLYKKVQEGLDRILGISRENLSGARVIRAFGQEDNEENRFKEANTRLYEMQSFVGKLSALTNPLTFLLINTAIIILIYSGALRVNSGSLTQGQVIALYNYMSQILVELIKLANLIVTVTKGVASANRIEAILEMTPADKSEGTLDFNGGDIEFKDVSLTYKNASSPSLSGINLTAKQGETIGVIGGTGSGKSSVVNLIPRFYEATEGVVTVNGTDVKEYSLTSLRDSIGIVPQSPLLFKGTIRDNMKMGNENATDEEITEALKAAQAYDFVSEKEGGIDYMLEPSGRNLSGGQKQRLTIARALVRKPKILILDDSASALDYATDAALRLSIAALDYKPTTFIVSQRASTVLYADKVLVLEDGEAVGFDAPERLLEDCDVYKEIYYAQFPDERRA